jgi:histidinol phosphatase-like enzyme
MKPTPLGKTYLEYEAELKEYNLAKTELAMQKIELGLIDDIQKEYTKYAKSQLAGNSQTDAVSIAAKKAINSYEQAIKDYGLIIQQINFVKKQATDLGVALPASVNSIDKEVASGIAYMNNRIKKLTIAAQVG